MHTVNAVRAVLSCVAADRMQYKIAFKGLPERIRLNTPHAAVICKIDAEIIGGRETDDFESGARPHRNADWQHPSADGDFTRAVLDDGSVRRFRGTRQPGEYFRQGVPEVVERWQLRKLVPEGCAT